VAGGEKRLQKPLAGQRPVARRSLTRSSGLIKTCVQETGCGTGGNAPSIAREIAEKFIGKKESEVSQHPGLWDR
jgi:hypothetical protein